MEEKKGTEKKTMGGKISAAYSKWRKKDSDRGILISHQTDTKGTHLNDTIKTTTTKSQVIFSSDKEYAEVHNDSSKSERVVNCFQNVSLKYRAQPFRMWSAFMPGCELLAKNGQIDHLTPD